MARLQPGSLSCREVRAGPRAGHQPLPRSYGLLASLLLGVQRVPPETDRGWWAGGRRGQSRASRDEEEALQFGLVFVESALARESSGPAWLRLRRWVVPEDPSGGGQVGTWQHSQDWAGLGAPRRLRTRLGHQDGLLPNFQNV